MAAEWLVETTAGEVRTPYVINCAGLHSDVMARLTGATPPVRSSRSAGSTTSW
jgi:malate dehydrogenase (quinone)/L-2-hydroxyglutarate oxidase